MVANQIFQYNDETESVFQHWDSFLTQNKVNFSDLKKIDLTRTSPVIFDLQNNKFSIDFLNDKKNYHKKKGSIKSELIGRALGSGRYGLNVLDLSAGLGIDAIFLMQLGFNVTAIERNPLIFLALEQARLSLPIEQQDKIKFLFSSALDYLKTAENCFDVIYFDPMFPEKVKSALPRQEMVFFRNLVGNDLDADEVLKKAIYIKGIQRVVVKRPIKAPVLLDKPESQIFGKLIRFDIYGIKK